jgi:hypothetical protein
MECRFECHEGRIIPQRVRYIMKWYLGMESRPRLNEEIDAIILALDQEAPHQYPTWTEPADHYGHVHIEMRQEEIDRLNENDGG